MSSSYLCQVTLGGNSKLGPIQQLMQSLGFTLKIEVNDKGVVAYYWMKEVLCGCAFRFHGSGIDECVLAAAIGALASPVDAWCAATIAEVSDAEK